MNTAPIPRAAAPIATGSPGSKASRPRTSAPSITFEDATPNPYLPFVGAGSPIIQKAQFENCMGARAPECTNENFAPIGTGPYKVDNFRPNDVIEFVANENYRVKTSPISRPSPGPAAATPPGRRARSSRPARWTTPGTCSLRPR
jgi:hypothetical protein